MAMRAGKVKVTDVMFPGGSPELVEPIYKNPLLSAPFNEQLAAAVRAYAEDRLQVCMLIALFCMADNSPDDIPAPVQPSNL